MILEHGGDNMKDTLVYTERIKKEREQKNYSYKLNYKSKTTYMYIENGSTQPTLQIMRGISKILGKPIAYFFNLEVQDS